MAGLWPQRHGYSPSVFRSGRNGGNQLQGGRDRLCCSLVAAYPQHSIVGHRQVQKSVNYLKNLSPNRKQYGKDEPEHRFAIDIIKTEVLLLATEIAD